MEISPAPFFTRLAAMMFDIILQFLTIYMLVPLVFGALIPEEFRGQVILGLFLATIFLYEPILVSIYGRTLSHRVYKIRVEDSQGGNIGFIQAFLRMLLKWFLGIYSMVTMVFGRHQAVHDHLTFSQVVRVN